MRHALMLGAMGLVVNWRVRSNMQPGFGPSLVFHCNWGSYAALRMDKSNAFFCGGPNCRHDSSRFADWPMRSSAWTIHFVRFSTARTISVWMLILLAALT